jgi:thioredoxin 1
VNRRFSLIEVVDDASLKKLFKANKKVIALFYASWCPFCRSFISVFNKHAGNPGSTLFVKVRIDEHENPMWETYSLIAVPSIIMFEDGKVCKRLDCELGTGLTERQFGKWLSAL